MIVKILIVDDEKGVLSLLARILTDDGFKTIVAEDGLMALEMLKAEKPDLIFLDIYMPDMSGIQNLK